MLSGTPGSDATMLMSDFGKSIEFFKAADIDSALATVALKGWKPFATAHPDNGSWRIIVGRPKQ
jgi:hypothetical protein